jgi:hypothetical protein
VPAAFISHFVLDAVPHWDYPLSSRMVAWDGAPAHTVSELIRSRGFWTDCLKIGTDVAGGLGLGDMSKDGVLGEGTRELSSSVVVLGEHGESVASRSQVNESDGVKGKSGLLEGLELTVCSYRLYLVGIFQFNFIVFHFLFLPFVGL